MVGLRNGLEISVDQTYSRGTTISVELSFGLLVSNRMVFLIQVRTSWIDDLAEASLNDHDAVLRFDDKELEYATTEVTLDVTRLCTEYILKKVHK